MPTSVPPGATIGIFGSGQLGRMLAQAAQRLGYRVHVFSSHAGSPAGQLAEKEFVTRYDDDAAIETFARSVDVLTLEFENVPVEAVDAAARFAPVRPSAAVLHAVQHRGREKNFLSEAGIPCAPFRIIRSRSELQNALAEVGCPAILKTAEFGYDGKGQFRIDKPEDAGEAWNALGPDEAVLEGLVDFRHELSILAVRGTDGSIAIYGPIANDHVNHILDVAVMPDEAVQSVRSDAADIARTIVDQLEVVGMICVEFFLTGDGRLLVNEIAPRPHNSGHLTIDACVTSQFEQHIRAVCGLPLGSAEQLRPAAMANLLGECWNGGAPDFSRALANPDVKLHLYGKTEPRPGRKMGHLTALASSGTLAERLVREARQALGK